VWVVESLLVTVTLAPGLTVSVAGPNLKFWIVTASLAAEAGFDGCVDGVSLLLDPPQAETRTTVARARTRREKRIARP
jgi:hypothetical protein